MAETVFHRSEPDWFESVKDLKPGGSRRISDAAKVSFNGRAWHRWDFREKTSEVYEPQMTLQERLRIIAQMTGADGSAIYSHKLPEPKMEHPQDWPNDARVWMHVAALDNIDINDMGAYWNPEMRRVVIPFDGLDGTESWIARHIDKAQDRPKYLFPADTRRGGGAFISGWNSEYTGVVTITEDYLSAYRVWRDVGTSVVSAMGTSLDRDAIVMIAKKYTAAILWLDPDLYGQMGQRRIRKDLGRLGMTTHGIISKRDPKLHPPEEISSYIRGALS